MLQVTRVNIPLVTDTNGDTAYDSCQMYDIGEAPFIPGENSSFYQTNNTIKCADADGWVYDTRQYQTTIINEVRTKSKSFAKMIALYIHVMYRSIHFPNSYIIQGP